MWRMKHVSPPAWDGIEGSHGGQWRLEQIEAWCAEAGVVLISIDEWNDIKEYAADTTDRIERVFRS